MTGGNPWPNVLADFKAKHQALGDIIASIETHFFNSAKPDEMPESPRPAELRGTGAARRNGKRPGPKPGLKKSIEKRQTDRQTDRQTEQTAGRRAARSLPNSAKSADNEEAILVVLRTKGPQQPGELAKRVGVHSLATLRYQMKGLLSSGRVVATGTTISRRFSLPGRGPKEDL